ncbi:hypothetical protein FRC01_012433, partial [Tulasnella sp. 417]
KPNIILFTGSLITSINIATPTESKCPKFAIPDNRTVHEALPIQPSITKKTFCVKQSSPEL